jgi:hypothetical protein
MPEPAALAADRLATGGPIPDAPGATAPAAPPPASGTGDSDLVVSGGGSNTIVASDALLAQLDRLDRVFDRLGHELAALEAVADRAEFRPSILVDVPYAAIEAHSLITAAVRALWVARARVAGIRFALVAGLAMYERADEMAMAVLHRVDENIAYGLGVGARFFGIPLLGGVAADVGIVDLVTGQTPKQNATTLQDFLKQHGRILTNPYTVGAIREMVSDVDGFGAGLSGESPITAEANEMSGVTTAATSAATIVAIANLVGIFKDSGADVRKTNSFEYGKPPTSLADRAASFPDAHGDPNGEQIRIDRYVTPGQPDKFDVYIGGTATFDPVAKAQPFDFTSDLTGVANETPASYIAVVKAMHDAGVTSTSPVVVNGYSQGGLIASMVAASGKFDVKGVVTFGAPSAQVHIPASVPVLSVRNSEDLVPATSGNDVNPHAVVVERSVFAHQSVPSDSAVPAHRLDYYQQTAAVVDRAQSERVRSVLDPLDSFGAGATKVDSTLWVATRVPDGLDAPSGDDPTALRAAAE